MRFRDVLYLVNASLRCLLHIEANIFMRLQYMQKTLHKSFAIRKKSVTLSSAIIAVAVCKQLVFSIYFSNLHFIHLWRYR